MACPMPDCVYSTGDQTEPVAIAYLNAHMYAHQTPPAQQQAAASIIRRGGPNLDRPTIETGISMEEWIMFTYRWDIFKEGSQIADNNPESLPLEFEVKQKPASTKQVPYASAQE